MSFHIDGATGACIVLIQFLVFVLAFLFAPKRGLVSSVGSSLSSDGEAGGLAGHAELEARI